MNELLLEVINNQSYNKGTMIFNDDPCEWIINLTPERKANDVDWIYVNSTIERIERNEDGNIVLYSKHFKVIYSMEAQ